MDQNRLGALLPDLVRERWQADCRDASPTSGGMNSVTVSAYVDHERCAAKWVPASDADRLRDGARTAERMAAAGLRSGPPLRTVDGQVAAEAAGGVVALLRWVDGEPLVGDNLQDQRAIGTVLASAHAVDGVTRQTGAFFASGITGHPELDLEPWVRPAVDEAVRAYDALPAVSWGTLHTDPAPEAFLRDGRQVGLIDWTGSTPGPLLYDLASAVMYAGGAHRAGALVESYLSWGVMDAREVEAHLAVFERLRLAVQAFYFAGRIARGDLTGILDQEENRAGLRHARDALT